MRIRNFLAGFMLLVVVAAVVAEETPHNVTQSKDLIAFQGTIESNLGDLVYAPTGKEIIRIKPNGEVLIAPGISLDEAAIGFWQAVRKAWPQTCK